MPYIRPHAVGFVVALAAALAMSVGSVLAQDADTIRGQCITNVMKAFPDTNPASPDSRARVERADHLFCDIVDGCRQPRFVRPHERGRVEWHLGETAGDGPGDLPFGHRGTTARDGKHLIDGPRRGVSGSSLRECRPRVPRQSGRRVRRTLRE